MDNLAKLQESGEMYLETILLLKKKKANVRATDIVAELGYSKSSVSRAVNLLKDKGLITIGEDTVLEFTEAGNKIAKETYDRHIILADFLMGLGVERSIAEEDACRIEHVISKESFEALKKIIK